MHLTQNIQYVVAACVFSAGDPCKSTVSLMKLSLVVGLAGYWNFFISAYCLNGSHRDVEQLVAGQCRIELSELSFNLGTLPEDIVVIWVETWA
jgi:hypothetical protein